MASQFLNAPAAAAAADAAFQPTPSQYDPSPMDIIQQQALVDEGRDGDEAEEEFDAVGVVVTPTVNPVRDVFHAPGLGFDQHVQPNEGGGRCSPEAAAEDGQQQSA